MYHHDGEGGKRRRKQQTQREMLLFVHVLTETPSRVIKQRHHLKALSQDERLAAPSSEPAPIGMPTAPVDKADALRCEVTQTLRQRGADDALEKALADAPGMSAALCSFPGAGLAGCTAARHQEEGIQPLPPCEIEVVLCWTPPSTVKGHGWQRAGQGAADP